GSQSPGGLAARAVPSRNRFGLLFRGKADGSTHRGRPCARAAAIAMLGSISESHEEEPMTDDERNQEALFRHAILGDVLSRNPRRGQLRPALKQLAQQTYQDHHGRSRRVAYKTLEEWFYN